MKSCATRKMTAHLTPGTDNHTFAMSESVDLIRVFLELHYHTLMPDLKFEVNAQPVETKSLLVSRDPQGFDKRIYDINHPLHDTNRLCIIMHDKPDLSIDQIMTQHFVIVRQIEIDGIRLDQVIHHCGSRMTLDLAWWRSSRARGQDLNPVSSNNLHIHGNGVWELEFTRPIWQWKCSWL